MMARASAVVETFRFIASHPMNRRRRIRALLVFAGWQVWKRTVGRPLTIAFWSSLRVRVHPDSRSAGLALYTRLPEYDDMLFTIRLLRPGDHVVDVGANIGLYSLLAGSRVGTGRVIALEPDPGANSRLRDNIALNDLSNIEVLAKAAGAAAGEALLTSGLDTVNYIVEVGSGVESISVALVALDDLCPPGEPVALIKVDAEGFESAVVAGARRLLEEGSVLAWIVEMNGLGERYGVEERTLLDVFQDHGYRPFHYNADEGILKPAGAVVEGDGWNLIFVKSLAEVLARLDPKPVAEGG